MTAELDFSGGSGEKQFPCFFHLPAATCILWLMVLRHIAFTSPASAGASVLFLLQPSCLPLMITYVITLRVNLGEAFHLKSLNLITRA